MKKINVDKYIKNSFWDVFQQIYVVLISFFIGLFSARYLGPDNYGSLGIINAILSIFSAVSWLGMDSIFVNEAVITNNKDKLIGTVFFVRLFLSFLFLLFALFIIHLIYDDKTLFDILLIQGLSMVFQVYELFNLWFQSQLKIKYSAVCMIIVQTVIAVFQIYLIFSGKNVLWFASILTVQNILLFVLLFYLLIFKSGVCPKFSFYEFKRLIKNSSHYIISSLSIVIYMMIDKLMIGKMLSSYSVGIYNAAVNISIIWQFIPFAIINTARPIIFKRKAADDEYLPLFKRLLFFLSLISIIVCVLISALAYPIIFILYGSGYLEAVHSLRILVWATAFAVIGVSRSIWIVANGFVKYDKYFTSIAAIINVIINYFAIKYYGVIGAAISTFISYFIEVFLVNYLFKETRVFNSIFLSAVKEYKESFDYAKKYIKNLIQE